MIKNQLASRYAKALFILAREEQKEDQFNSDLQKIIKLKKENSQFKKLLDHQRVLADEKKKVIKQILGKKIDKTIMNFLFLLVDKRRIGVLELIINEYSKLLNKYKKIVEIEVITAVKMEEKLQKELENKLNNLLDQQIVLNISCDAEIIGGLMIKINDYLIDGSIRRKLELMKERIENIPVSQLGVLNNAN